MASHAEPRRPSQPLFPAAPVVRALLAASVVAGAIYPWLDGRLGLAGGVVAKGLGVGLLALAALRPGSRWLAAILALGSLGDVLLDLPGLFFVGAGVFAIGHVVAMAFYNNCRQPAPSAASRAGAAALIAYGVAMPWAVSPAGTSVGGLMLYSVLLCGMAAALLLSRLPRLAVIGALLFVVSDTLLIMRLGGALVGPAFVHGLAVWYSYYAGQLLIFAGVRAGIVRGD
jgi:uncharacterized membrane protein YhhN